MAKCTLPDDSMGIFSCDRDGQSENCAGCPHCHEEPQPEQMPLIDLDLGGLIRWEMTRYMSLHAHGEEEIVIENIVKITQRWCAVHDAKTIRTFTQYCVREFSPCERAHGHQLRKACEEYIKGIGMAESHYPATETEYVDRQ